MKVIQNKVAREYYMESLRGISDRGRGRPVSRPLPESGWTLVRRKFGLI
jgi:hypothetical protein